MTDSALQKEAERIRKYMRSHTIGDEHFSGFVLRILRAVHDSAYTAGFNAAMEEAAKLEKEPGVYSKHDMANVIRSFKLGKPKNSCCFLGNHESGEHDRSCEKGRKE